MMKRIYSFIVLVLVPFLIMCSGPYGPMMGGYGPGYGMMGGYGGMFMWPILLIMIGMLIYFVIQNQKTKGPSSKSPLDILKERYAKGEITKEEFDRMKNDIK